MGTEVLIHVRSIEFDEGAKYRSLWECHRHRLERIEPGFSVSASEGPWSPGGSSAKMQHAGSDRTIRNDGAVIAVEIHEFRHTAAEIPQFHLQRIVNIAGPKTDEFDITEFAAVEFGEAKSLKIAKQHKILH
jgi:hypothetical protein